MKSSRVREWVTENAMVGEYSSNLGDKRRSQRGQSVGAALSAKPNLSLPKIFPDEADLEATYRLLRNPMILWRDLASAHIGRTVERSSQATEVLVAHDTSEIAFRMYWAEERRSQMSRFASHTQGFFLHTSLVITANGLAVPLGIVNLQPFVHRSGLPAKDIEARVFWENEAGLFDNEHERWFRSVGIAHDELAKQNIEPVHVMDCETDSYGMLSWLVQNGHRFVSRSDGGRKLNYDDGMRDFGTLTVELGERFALRTGKVGANPPRRARTARLTVRAGVMTLNRARRAKDASWSPGGFAEQPETLPLHLVEAVERNPPPGEKGVRWLLWTKEPIETAEQVLRVIEWYRRRWMIEEYFKALKTGCRLEERQMDSATTMLRMLALLVPAAWRLLLLRVVATEAPESKWTQLLTPLEFRILTRAIPKAKLQADADITQCTAAIAKLGGHLPRNGPPGWQTLHAGWRQLQDLVLGAHLAREK